MVTQDSSGLQLSNETVTDPLSDRTGQPYMCSVNTVCSMYSECLEEVSPLSLSFRMPYSACAATGGDQGNLHDDEHREKNENSGGLQAICNTERQGSEHSLELS